MSTPEMSLEEFHKQFPDAEKIMARFTAPANQNVDPKEGSREVVGNVNQGVAVTAETELRELRKEEIESYLSRKMCCDGRECGCGGVTILQHLVLEEVGNQLIDLRQENSALQAREQKLVEALKRTTGALGAGFGKDQLAHIKAQADAALSPQPTHEGTKT